MDVYAFNHRRLCTYNQNFLLKNIIVSEQLLEFEMEAVSSKGNVIFLTITASLR